MNNVVVCDIQQKPVYHCVMVIQRGGGEEGEGGTSCTSQENLKNKTQK
jgi:hypothetical protein